jgi:RES domain-containing protein
LTTVFRITKARHAATAFSGEGARRAGGRWNFPGEPIVYCSSSLSLAALETFVHLGEEGRSIEFVFLEAVIPASARIDHVTKLPKGWRQEPPGEPSMEVGSKWFRELQSLALAVPSATVPQESNILLNPLHPDFARVTVSKPKPFSFDPRIWK